eukprot:2671482-Rhodomonas_salina.6
MASNAPLSAHALLGSSTVGSMEPSSVGNWSWKWRSGADIGAFSIEPSRMAATMLRVATMSMRLPTP